MTRDAIRRRTRLIIRKDGEYLAFVCYETRIIRGSTSPWEAWGTRNREAARMVARRVQGEIMLFNPITGEIRKAAER